MNKAKERLTAKTTQKTGMTKDLSDSIFLSSDKNHYQVKLSEILYLEAYGNFVKIYTTERMILVSGSMKSMEEKLPLDQFVRVHKSYIVPLAKIEKLSGNTLYISDKAIPVGRYYKKELENRMG